MGNDHGAGNTPIRLIADTSLWPTNYVQRHGNGYPIIARHAREGGHPGFLTGFPQKHAGMTTWDIGTLFCGAVLSILSIIISD